MAGDVDYKEADKRLIPGAIMNSSSAIRIRHRSSFKDELTDKDWFINWVKRLEASNDRQYDQFEIETSLGITKVYGIPAKGTEQETLIIFPGARTTSLFWDLDRALDQLGTGVRILMVETNGLPNLSDGATPDIKSTDYGHWAAEVLNLLNIQQAHLAGASFGGLIAMKLALTHPAKVRKVFLLNPGCLQPFSLSFKNLYYNLLPIFSPTVSNIRKFLDAAIFCKPGHQLSTEAEQLLVEYEFFALTRYQDRTQKPYFMGKELKKVTSEVYLLEGDRDILFPFQKSIDNARKYLPSLKEVKVFNNVGHGIETYKPALKFIGERLKNEK